MSKVRDRILGQCSPKQLERFREPVDVPEWGEKLYVGIMSGDQRDAFESRMEELRRSRSNNKQRVDLRHMKATLVVFCVFDADGSLVFVLDDVERLNQGNAIAIQRLYRVAARLNKVWEQDLEDLVGNSDAAPSGSSGSSSPGPSEKASGKSKRK